MNANEIIGVYEPPVSEAFELMAYGLICAISEVKDPFGGEEEAW